MSKRAQAGECMTPSDFLDISGDTPALYEICIRGALDTKWCDLIEGMTMEVIHEDSQPLTVFHVVLRDQSELAGLLDALFGANATVLSVTALEAASRNKES